MEEITPKQRPLSAAEYIQFENTGSIAESFKFCRHELPIRLINILEESNALPISFVPEKILEIKDKYNATLEGLLPFIHRDWPKWPAIDPVTSHVAETYRID